MAKRKSKKRMRKRIQKTVISLLLMLILAVVGYFFQDELPFDFGSGPAGTLGGQIASIPAITDPNYLSVHYIDVGQGDSIFLACGGEYMLIDAGETDSDDTVIHYLNNLDIDRLDLVVATHGDSDHIGEMDDVLNAVPADVVWYPDYNHGTLTEASFLTAAENCGANLYRPELGETYDLGGATVTVLQMQTLQKSKKQCEML